MLEVQNLTKRYNKTLAVDNVSFTVNSGRIGILLVSTARENLR